MDPAPACRAATVPAPYAIPPWVIGGAVLDDHHATSGEIGARIERDR